MAPPTVWQIVRQTLGRAVRETGQAMDRLGLRTSSFAVTVTKAANDNNNNDHHYNHNDDDDHPLIYQDHLSRHRNQFPLLHAGRPVVHPDVAYLAPCSTLIGSVRIGKGSSVWYGAILRADNCENAESFNKLPKLDEETSDSHRDDDNDDSNDNVDDDIWELDENRFENQPNRRNGGGIFIGENTNIQDNCIITSRENHCIIGNGVTIGHLAQIHSATVEDFCLIGMGSIIQEGAVIERESFVAAGAVVGPGQVVRSGELWVGNPARKLRDLGEEGRAKLHYQSSEYVQVATEQHDVMQLGGNLSDSMFHTEYLIEAVSGQGQKTPEGTRPADNSDEDGSRENLKTGTQ